MLDEIQVMPPNFEYRAVVEKYAKERLAVIQDSSLSVEQMETKISKGQVTEAPLDRHCPPSAAAPSTREFSEIALCQLEEMIERAKDELELIPIMMEWQPWNDDSLETPFKPDHPQFGKQGVPEVEEIAPAKRLVP